MKAAALRGALSDRARHGRIHVFSALVEGLKPSTKAAWKVLDGLSERKNLLVVVERTDAVSLSSLRNLENVHVLVADQLNTYDVLCADDIVFTEGSLSTFLAGPTKGRVEKVAKVDSANAESLTETPEVAKKAAPKVAKKAAPTVAQEPDAPSAKTADDEEETT
jgi:large subunit ribosomal protein L4